MRQAGEKYWGAATQIIKVYCKLNGWHHDGHAKLFQDVGEICKEPDGQKIKEQFGLADMLHTNFYEGWLTKEDIEDYANQSKELIAKIKILIEGSIKRRIKNDRN